MKKILLYMAIALHCLAGTQAAENVADNQATEDRPLIPCRVINTKQTRKTLLEGKVIYNDTKKKKFSIVLDEITKETPKLQENILLPSGEITKIVLILYNYHGEKHRTKEYKSKPDYCKETFITGLSFAPETFPSLLKEITFTIRSSETGIGSKIDAQPTYD